MTWPVRGLSAARNLAPVGRGGALAYLVTTTGGTEAGGGQPGHGYARRHTRSPTA
ncbi:hypothetical protein [Streptomyces sp. NBC_01235]|uniref:hypothetical protein n=1 Tax=Streptomyces sp. NBC_01235 TaxID=2903788 RepID=UPI002E10C91A|nr:hypothetical protein OG289_40145 [Streptomyces sp. NBC_01235]